MTSGLLGDEVDEVSWRKVSTCSSFSGSREYVECCPSKKPHDAGQFVSHVSNVCDETSGVGRHEIFSR